MGTGEPFRCSRDQLATLCEHEDELVALTAEVVYEHRYEEAPPDTTGDASDSDAPSQTDVEREIEALDPDEVP